MAQRIRRITLLLSAMTLGLATTAWASDVSDEQLSQEDRIAELERTVGVLVDELERTRADLAVPEEPSLVSQFGLGPAASKIYSVTRGLSVGGYGEAFYRHILDDAGTGTGKARDSADFLRLVLYTGYKFTESLLFNAEIEFEHASTGSSATSGGGSVSVEFAYLDFFWKDWANFRAGLLLVPMGFLNEVHEPPFYLGVNRPEVEREILPSTWRENGAGVFGRLGEQVDYEVYVVNGFNAEGFEPGGLRDGRQNGNRALAEHLAVVTSLDWTPIPELLLGGSVYLGQSGQNQNLARFGGGPSVQVPDAFTALWEVHSQFESRGLHLRGLFTMAHIDDAGSLTAALQSAAAGSSTILKASEAIAREMIGAYAEVSYDVLPCLFPGTERSLSPYYRYEWYDTQYDMPGGFAPDEGFERQIHTLGIAFKPIPNVVLKLDWRNQIAADGGRPDEVNLGMGFAF